MTVLFPLICISVSQAQYYVDSNATGANDGSSWENAYIDLNTPLGIIAGGEIWVKSGTYVPGSGTPDSSSTFKIASSISIYGGFDGTEIMLSERDIAANPTILSGDVNGDDIDGNFDDNRSDNVQHVVFADSLLLGCTIDGFIIENGHASDNSAVDEFHRAGAGIFSYSSIVIKNCTFRENFAQIGAGVCLSAKEGDSGIITVDFDKCLFSSNMAADLGGAVYQGGGIIGTYDNCHFFKNQAMNSAGALALMTFKEDAETGTALVENSIFNFNSAPNAGGAISIIDIQTAFTNNLIHDNLSNDADGMGAGIYVEATDSNFASVNAFNNTIVNNFSPSGSGIAFVRSAVETTNALISLTNNIISNFGTDIEMISGVENIVSEGGNISGDDGSGFLDDPMDQINISDLMFVDIENYDFHLTENSPAVDAGRPFGSPTMDIEGNDRIGIVDVGAFEFIPTSDISYILDDSVLEIFPNPAQGVLNYEFNHSYNGKIEFFIVDTNGKLIKRWIDNMSNNFLLGKQQLEGIAAGNYFLHLRFGGYELNKQLKIIK